MFRFQNDRIMYNTVLYTKLLYTPSSVPLHIHPSFLPNTTI